MPVRCSRYDVEGVFNVREGFEFSVLPPTQCISQSFGHPPLGGHLYHLYRGPSTHGRFRSERLSRKSENVTVGPGIDVRQANLGRIKPSLNLRTWGGIDMKKCNGGQGLAIQHRSFHGAKRKSCG